MMNWKNLQKNLCPKCGCDLREEEVGFECQSRECNYFITKGKMKEVKSSLNQNNARKEMEGYGFD